MATPKITPSNLNWLLPTANGTSINRLPWRRHYWLVAGIIPLLFFIFEVLTVSAYPNMRAPNVGLVAQLTFMLGFFALWVLVPRTIWVFAKEPVVKSLAVQLLFKLLVAGVLMSIIHLLLLTFVLRMMHSPPGWGLSHLLHSFGEVWLSKALIWLLAYTVAAGMIVFVMLRQPSKSANVSRIEVRHKGKTRLLPLSDIYWIQASGNYTEIHSSDGLMVIRKPLSQFARELAGAGFLKSHRSALVNTRHVCAVKPGGNGQGYVVLLEDGHEAPLSRRALSEFKALVKNGD